MEVEDLLVVAEAVVAAVAVVVVGQTALLPEEAVRDDLEVFRRG